MGVLDVPPLRVLPPDAPVRAPHAPVTEWFAHSYGQGAGVIAASLRASSIVCAELGCTEINRSIRAADTGLGIYRSVFRYSDAVHRARVAAPWREPFRDYGFLSGINDVGNITLTATGYANVVKAIISRLRSCSVFEHGHASVALTGGSWSSGSATSNWEVSGNDWATNSSAAGIVTITVPSWFPGGTIALGVACKSNSSAVLTDGADWSASVDGGAAVTLVTRSGDTFYKASGAYNPRVLRLTGLAAGAHTIVLSITALTGAAIFDYWQVEAPSGSRPIVAVATCPRLPATGYSNFATGLTQTTGDTAVEAQNVAVRAMVTEFDDHVVIAEVDAAFGRTDLPLSAGNYYGLFAADSLHPTAKGYGAMAGAFVTAINGVPR